MTKLALTAAVGAMALMASCGGDGPNRPAPSIIPGGGITNGGIDSLLNVYVIDEDSKTPVANATVRVGASADPDACSATTDSTGLAVFDRDKGCKILGGKQEVTATATDHIPATWIGVDGANITIGIRPRTPASVATATVSGSIEGWDGFPAPGTHHNQLGLVIASSSSEAGDSANNLAQDTRNVLLVVPIPSNACVRNALVNDCNWTLKTRTGRVAIYALILDQDTKGTSDDETDDTWSSLGFALKTGYNLSKDQVLTGETLPLIPDTDTTTLTVSFTQPSALGYTQAMPQIDLGTDGRITILRPKGMSGTPVTLKVPKLVGALASGRFDVLTTAQPSETDDMPAVGTYIHGVDPTQPVTASDWLPTPTGLAVQNGTYSFARVPGAHAFGVELRARKGAPSWNISVFDDSSSFTLPGLATDPLPAGTLEMVVTALEAPGVNIRDIQFRDLEDKLHRVSSDLITFVH